MKTHTRRLATLLLLILAGLMPAQAVDDYGITIGGVKVTSDNASNVSNGASNITGSVRYDNSTCTLTLQNATIDCQNRNALVINGSFAKEVKINLVGVNTFTNVLSNGVGFALNINSSSASKFISFQGTGSVEVPASIAVDGSTSQVYIKESCTVKCTYCYSKVGGQLYVEDAATLHLYRGSSYAGSLYGFSQFYRTGGAMMLIPEGAYYDTTNKYLVDSNGNRVNGEVKIGPVDYGLTVGGVKVTSVNMNNITGSNISGKVSLSRTGGENTLVLEDATINNSQGYGIGNKSGQPLIINVRGTCSVSGTHAIYSKDDLTIIGGFDLPSLTVNGTISGILVDDDKTLCLSFVDITASGATNSGCIRGGGMSKLVMLYSELDIDSGSFPCVKGFDSCVQNLMEVSYPAEVWFSSSTTGYVNDKGLITGDLKLKRISEEYGIEVAGHKLNDLNKQNFYYENVSGFLDYDSMSGLLTIAEFVANCNGVSQGIYIKSNKDVTIFFEGDNKFYNTCDKKGIDAQIGGKKLDILGFGSIEFDGGLDVIGDLQIVNEEEGEGLTLKATSISGIDYYDFIVSNCRVYLTGDGVNSTIRGFRSIEGSNFTFARPINATYSDGQLWKNGQVVTGSVIISYKDYDTAIDETVQEGGLTVDATYDVAGRRTDSPRGGLFLQRMSDGSVRKQFVK